MATMESSSVQVPTTDLDKKDKKWLEDIDRSIEARRLEEPRWTVNEAYEDMKQWYDGSDNMVEGEDDEITINKVGSYIRDYRAQIAFNDPRGKFAPKSSDGWKPIPVPVIGPDGQPEVDEQTGQMVVREVVKVKVREALLNGIIGQPMFGMQATGSRLIKAGLLGVGFLKVGYRPTFETAPDPEGEQTIPIVDGKLNTDGFMKNPVDGSLVASEDGKRLIERTEIPTYEDWFISWVPYRNMLIDPEGGNDWRDHRFVGEEIFRDLDEVKKDKLFKDTEDLKASGHWENSGDDGLEWKPGRSEYSEFDDTENIKRDNIVRLFEIYDLVNNRLLVYADGYNKVLRDVPMPLGITDHPYVDFRPNEILGKFYSRPIVTDLIPPCTAYNIMRQRQLRASKRSDRKILVRRGVLDPVEMENLTNDEDNAIVEIDSKKYGFSSMDEVVRPWTPAPVSEALYRDSQASAYDFDEIGGMSQAARGAGSSETATESGIIEQHSTSRIEFDRKVLSATYVRAIKKLNDSIDANMTKARAVQLEGSDGQVFSAMVDRDLIAGDVDVDVDFEDMAPTSSGMQAQQIIQFLQVINQNMAIMSDEVLAREFLSMFGKKNERLVQAMVRVAQRQMQMEEMVAQAQAAQAQAAANAPPPNAEAKPPASEAEAAKKSAAGGQTPRMSGAS